MRTHFSKRGFAIVSVLLVLAVLTIMVVAFMQSMRIDRLTSRAYLNKAQADMAADMGLSQAQQMLKALFESYPDSVTSWRESGSNAANIFCYRSYTTPAIPPAPLENPTIQVVPLVSGGASMAPATLDSFLSGLSSSNSANLSSDRGLSETIGDALHTANAPAFRGEWIEVLADPSRPNQPDSTQSDYNPIVARFAFWIEDQSFKLNINEIGASPRGGNTTGADPGEISIEPLLSELRSKKSSVYSGLPETAANAFVDYRSNQPNSRFIQFRDMNRMMGSGDYRQIADDLAYYLTGQSSTLNLNRYGIKRLNLNQLISDSTDPDEIRLQLDRMITGIQQWLPGFGQRFYRTGSDPNADDVSSDHEEIYLQKLAANVRDYIDNDFQPTIVKNDTGRSIEVGSKPTVAIGFNSSGSPNDVMAIGKEPALELAENAVRYRVISMVPPRYTVSTPEAAFEIHVDYYFEFWNPTTTDVTLADLGPNPFIKVYNQMAYDTGGGSNIPPGRDFEIPLADFEDGNGDPLVFRAGQSTVVTTDAAPSTALTGNPQSVYRPATPNSYTDINGDPTRQYTGITQSYASSTGRFRVNPITRTTGGSDYETEMLIGNDLGLISSFPALTGTVNLSIYEYGVNASSNAEDYFFRGGSLRGNESSGASGSQQGDPRTLNEQLYIQRYSSSLGEDATRFWSSGLNNADVPASSTFGNTDNSFLDSTQWPDYSPISTNAATSPSVVANRGMQSIGELGHIFDPMRELRVNSSTGIRYSRGGGRTLRIGQSDQTNNQGIWDGSTTSTSFGRTAWQLTDIFSVSSGLELPGRLNIHSFLRDEGLTLKAVLDRFEAGSAEFSDTNISGEEADIEKFLEALQTYFNPGTAGPAQVFWQRGQLSELPLFHDSSDLYPRDMNTVIDRGREEFVRRNLELLTTRGNTFRIYCVGQAIRQRRNGDLSIAARSAQHVTIKLTPVLLPANEDDAFDPSDPTSVEDRLQTIPDNYEITILDSMHY